MRPGALCRGLAGRSRGRFGIERALRQRAQLGGNCPVAIRELREETGLEIAPECIDAPHWRREVSYVYRHVHRQQHEIVVAARLTQEAPPIGDQNRFDAEKDDVLGAQWWSLQDIAASRERFYPKSLARLLPAFLRGEAISEPLEVWP